MQGMMSGPPRGMRGSRGGMGYQGRGGGYQPRGGAPMGMRGGRPPLYSQRKFPQTTLDFLPYLVNPIQSNLAPKQHTGAENNKTVSPVPTSAISGEQPAVEAAGDEVTDGQTSAVVPSSGNSHGGSSAPGGSNGGGPPPYLGRGRGRGGPFSGRGRGGGGYNSHMNGSGGGSMYGGSHSHHGNSMGGGPGSEHGSMPRRGGPRGRGGYNQGMSRPPLHHHQAHNPNTQLAPVPALKRGAPGGPGPKRGRYEGGPYGQRPMTPKYHSTQQHMGGGGGGGMSSQSSYGSPPSHHAPQQR